MVLEYLDVKRRGRKSAEAVESLTTVAKEVVKDQVVAYAMRVRYLPGGQTSGVVEYLRGSHTTAEWVLS